MDDFLHKGKEKFKHAFDKFTGPQSHYTPSVPITMQRLGTETDIWRMRKQRGVNLGSWFTLERWIASGPFANALGPGQADLHVAQGWNAREILEHHWDMWITDSDWQWLAQHGFNTVRIPIGYYHLVGLDPRVIEGTDFANYGDVYKGAWQRIDRAIEKAAHHGFGVLIDLHAAPGAQNNDAHAGTGTGRTEFWKHTNLRATVFCLEVLLRNLVNRPNVVGLELINEPAANSSLWSWYQSTFAALRSISPDMPLYIGDAWDPNTFTTKAGERDDHIVVDTHVYRCFTPEDHRKSGDQHAHELSSGTVHWFRDLSSKCRGNLIVGEFSAALNPNSYPPGCDDGEKDRQRRVFLRAELDLFEECCAGWFFWTYKKQEGWDAGWDLRNARLADIFPSFVGKRPYDGPMPSPHEREGAKNGALDAHNNYWKDKAPYHEPWRFEAGFYQGWDDGLLFFDFKRGGSLTELGFKGEWTRRRLAEYVAAYGGNSCNWEFEHGFSQGYAAVLKRVAS